uniref:Uncharacterized protein n=1 Tax=Trichuris muris TaxID=70415 RepID=A0A5S6QEM0_TRIMR
MTEVCLPYAEDLVTGKLQNLVDNVLLCRTIVMVINSGTYFASLIGLIMTSKFLEGDVHSFMVQIIESNKAARQEFNLLSFWSTFVLVLVVGTLIYQIGNLFSLYNRNYKMIHHSLRLGVLLTVCYFINASILLKSCTFTPLWEKCTMIFWITCNGHFPAADSGEQMITTEWQIVPELVGVGRCL